MTRIVAVAPVLPAYAYSQAEITRELAPLISPDPSRRAVLERMHAGSRIGTRHTALPLEQYRELGGFREANDVFIEQATNLAELALRTALDEAGLTASDVDFVFFTSVTGIAAPSIDALLVPRLGLRPDVKRLPTFGLGCVAGAAGLARVHDYLVGHPTEVGVLLSVELCSLTLQRDDATIANFVATGLFGDGAAAVVLVGDDRPEPGIEVVDTRSAFFPETTDVIGWNIGGTGFEIVLTSGVADVIERHFPPVVADFLADQPPHDRRRRRLGRASRRPAGARGVRGGARGGRRGDFARSWEALEQVGNLSSAAVLHVLAATDAGARHPRPAVRARPRGERRVRAAAVALMLGLILGRALHRLHAATGGERIFELFVSKRNAAAAFAKGGVEYGPRALPVDGRAAHRAPARVHRRGRACRPPVHPVAGLADARDRAGVPGRAVLDHPLARPAVEHPDHRVPGAQRVARSRPVPASMPHPNYVIVAVEGIALPLIHTAWITAIAFTVLNAILLLGFRIPAEDRALKQLA